MTNGMMALIGGVLVLACIHVVVFITVRRILKRSDEIDRTIQ
jgi:hypothetical protein